MGIQKIPVTVRLLGSNSSDSVKVIFNPGKGTIEPEFLYVQYNKPETVYLRSEGTGDCKLTATAAAITSNELNVKFIFPWLFLGAALFGGIAGSFAKYLKEKESTTKLIVAAILAGIIGAAAYYGLGVNLLGISLAAGLNELAVFALSALCAYFGLSLGKKS